MKLRPTSCWPLVYLVGVVLLSSVDVVYEFETGEPSDWHEVVGLRSGAVMVGSWRGAFARGLGMDVHLPQFSAPPVFVSAGPDSGVTGVAVWFLSLVALGFHWLLRARRLRRVGIVTPGE